MTFGNDAGGIPDLNCGPSFFSSVVLRCVHDALLDARVCALMLFVSQLLNFFSSPLTSVHSALGAFATMR